MTPAELAGIAQVIGVILGALGLSAAPWVAAVLWGRLLTLRQHEARVTDLKEAKADAERRADKAEQLRTTEYERAETERTRADDLAAKLADLAGGMGSTAVELLKQLQPADGGGDGGGR